LRELFLTALKNDGDEDDGTYDWMLLNNGKGWETNGVGCEACPDGPADLFRHRLLRMWLDGIRGLDRRRSIRNGWTGCGVVQQEGPRLCEWALIPIRIPLMRTGNNVNRVKPGLQCPTRAIRPLSACLPQVPFQPLVDNHSKDTRLLLSMPSLRTIEETNHMTPLMSLSHLRPGCSQWPL